MAHALIFLDHTPVPVISGILAYIVRLTLMNVPVGTVVISLMVVVIIWMPPALVQNATKDLNVCVGMDSQVYIWNQKAYSLNLTSSCLSTGQHSIHSEHLFYSESVKAFETCRYVLYSICMYMYMRVSHRLDEGFKAAVLDQQASNLDTWCRCSWFFNQMKGMITSTYYSKHKSAAKTYNKLRLT